MKPTDSHLTEEMRDRLTALDKWEAGEYPQVEHLWAGDEDGHNCETCGPDSIWKCDMLAHATATLEFDTQKLAEERAEENLRKHGGIAGPGVRHV